MLYWITHILTAGPGRAAPRSSRRVGRAAQKAPDCVREVAARIHFSARDPGGGGGGGKSPSTGARDCPTCSCTHLPPLLGALPPARPPVRRQTHRTRARCR